MGFAGCRGPRSSSASGKMKRTGRELPEGAAAGRGPCSPDRLRGGACGSGVPPCASIHAMTASKSDPAASSAARSTTSSPRRCGRASRLTRARIASSSAALSPATGPAGCLSTVMWRPPPISGLFVTGPPLHRVQCPAQPRIGARGDPLELGETTRFATPEEDSALIQGGALPCVARERPQLVDRWRGGAHPDCDRRRRALLRCCDHRDDGIRRAGRWGGAGSGRPAPSAPRTREAADSVGHGRVSC